ncbi:hypothetical protein J5837_15070 [Pseudoxanthomonas helianthi]|uniref:Uncharacterized protein n=1 Tax=Pseudoxanthomonas helianthi TaxID=1453541 RepID=A0A940X5F9_9GAMM|nr:hypothetical protein [Pseudoxanthomonas helianthi]MBP3985730.1 hypothetical protein [Pseudoxanthomonas helianthi]
MNATTLTGEKSADTAISLSEFLESAPPGVNRKISDFKTQQNGTVYYLILPKIRIHCSSEQCGGIRTFSSSSRITIHGNTSTSEFIHYSCQNCNRTYKTYAARLKLGEDAAFKFGEDPSFGPPTPARAMTLIGGDRDLFLKGRRCELQGLGVGAFTYYRRVIEDQRNRIFDEIIRVLEATDSNNPVILEVKSAKEQQQFSTSVDVIKHALPATLLINGENPLRLLHSALSEGVHAMSDEDCLALATAVRTVLFEFSERLAQTLRDDAQLAEAVKLLSKPKQTN